MNFAPGDRVVWIGYDHGDGIGPKSEMLGSVLWVEPGTVSVEFDVDIDGHDGTDCDHRCGGQDGHCWFCNFDELLPDTILKDDLILVSDFDSVL